MEKSFDLVIVELKEKLISTINESGLPLSIISYVIKDIHQVVDTELSKRIAHDKEQLEKSEPEK